MDGTTDYCDSACPGISSATVSRFERASKLTEKAGNLSREVLAMNGCRVWAFVSPASRVLD